MNTDIICQELQKKLWDAFSVEYDVVYGEVPNLGNWFYIKRKYYGGYYRLGMFENSAKSFVDTTIKMGWGYVPKDLIKAT